MYLVMHEDDPFYCDDLSQETLANFDQNVVTEIYHIAILQAGHITILQAGSVNSEDVEDDDEDTPQHEGVHYEVVNWSEVPRGS